MKYVDVVGFERGLHGSAGDKKIAVPRVLSTVNLGGRTPVLACTVHMGIDSDDMKVFSGFFNSGNNQRCKMLHFPEM